MARFVSKVLVSTAFAYIMAPPLMYILSAWAYPQHLMVGLIGFFALLPALLVPAVVFVIGSNSFRRLAVSLLFASMAAGVSAKAFGYEGKLVSIPFVRWSLDAYEDTLMLAGYLFVAGFVPAALVMRYRVRKRRSIGRCHQCNYDLTGNVSGVCPECGTAVQEHDAGGNESVPTKEED